MRRFAIAACMLACGGQTVGADGGLDSGNHDSAITTKDAGSDATSLSPDCPIIPPNEGTSCTLSDGFQCEYGPSYWAICDPVFTCTGNAWNLNTTQPCPVEEGTDCPSTYSQITAGADCTTQSKENESCGYPQGECLCEGQCGGPFIAGAGITWKCDTPDPTCPWPRPRFGSVCSGNANCQYAICCAGSQMQCTNATWQGTTTSAGCP